MREGMILLSGTVVRKSKNLGHRSWTSASDDKNILSNVVKWFFAAHFLLSITELCQGRIEIKSLLIPERIENGTEESIILDCIYTLDEKDDKNMVVKWFLDNDPEPIYQWIPEYESRQPSEKFKDRINMAFAVHTIGPYTKYRAINIVRPSVELSGRYSCHVMSLTSQDSEEKFMLVYAPPSRFDFNYSQISREEARSIAERKAIAESVENKSEAFMNMLDSGFGAGVKLKCSVEDIYPFPELKFYRITSDGSKYMVPSGDMQMSHERKANRAYDVEITADVVDLILASRNEKESVAFECLLFMDLNGVNYTKSIVLPFFKDSLINSAQKLTLCSRPTLYLFFLPFILNRVRWKL